MCWEEDTYISYEIISDLTSIATDTSFNVTFALHKFYFDIIEIIKIFSFLQFDLPFSLFDEKAITLDERVIKCVTESKWSSHALDFTLWNDDKAPVIKLRNLKDILFDDLEFCGFVTDRLIGSGKSFLTKSPEIGLYVLSKCIMRNMVYYFILKNNILQYFKGYIFIYIFIFIVTFKYYNVKLSSLFTIY